MASDEAPLRVAGDGEFVALRGVESETVVVEGSDNLVSVESPEDVVLRVTGDGNDVHARDAAGLVTEIDGDGTTLDTRGDGREITVTAGTEWARVDARGGRHHGIDPRGDHETVRLDATRAGPSLDMGVIPRPDPETVEGTGHDVSVSGGRSGVAFLDTNPFADGGRLDRDEVRGADPQPEASAVRVTGTARATVHAPRASAVRVAASAEESSPGTTARGGRRRTRGCSTRPTGTSATGSRSRPNDSTG